MKRRVPLKWVFVGAAVLVVVMAAIVVTVVLVDHDRDEARRAAAIAATSSTEFTSPYDFSELSDDAGPDAVGGASFLSVYISDEGGALTSYGMDSALPAVKALSDAIKNADEVDPATAAPVGGVSDEAEGAGARNVPTITFVFPDRGTLTFVLDLGRGLIARGDRAWRPAGDLSALVDAAVERR